MEVFVLKKLADEIDDFFFDELTMKVRRFFHFGVRQAYLSLSDSLCSIVFLHHLQYFLSLSFSGWLILLRLVR